MDDQARKASADAGGRPSVSGDGASRADPAAQSGNNRRSKGRLGTGWVGGGVGGCLVLLLACLVLSVAYPVEAQAMFTSLKATIKSIGAQRPYQTDALPTQMTLWQGRLYATGPFQSTSVYAPATGKQLSTFPGVVVGSDEQRLYVGLGRALMTVSHGGSASAAAIARLPLVAQDARDARMWTYPTSAGEIGDQYHTETWICELQSSGDLLYVRLSRQIVALDKTDGALRWSYPYDSLACSQAVHLTPTQQTLYLLAGGRVIALSARDGSQLTGQRWQGPSEAERIIADVDGQVVYASDDARAVDGMIAARDAATGAVLWQTAGPRRGPTYLLGVRDGVLYVLQDHPAQLTALSAATGRMLWSVALVYDVPSQEAAFVGATQALVYVALGATGSSSQNHGPSYLAFDTHSGALRWQHSVPEARSVWLLADQSLYSAALLHRRQVTTGWFGVPTDVANCSDSASVYHLSAVGGEVVWQRAASFSCTSQDNYF